MRMASLFRLLHVSHKKGEAPGCILASVRLTKFIFLHMISLQSLAKAALSFGVYLVVTLIDILDITLAFFWKTSNNLAMPLFRPEKAVNFSGCFRYEVRQESFKREWPLFSISICLY